MDYVMDMDIGTKDLTQILLKPGGHSQRSLKFNTVSSGFWEDF